MIDRAAVPPEESGTAKGHIYYGYVIVISTFIILGVIFGTNYSFGIFFNRLLQEFGWSRAVTSTGYSIGQFLGGILGIVTGKLGDRFGPRNIVLACIASLAAGCLLMSLVSQPWQLYLFYGILVGFGVGGAAIPLSANIAHWFERKKGLMTGIVVAGIGTGTILMPLLINRFLDVFGWRTTFIILGILVIVLVAPLAFFVKGSPPGVKRQMGTAGNKAKIQATPPWRGINFRGALRTPQFWIIAAIYILVGVYVQSIMVHIVPFARSTGIEAGSAAAIMSFLGLGSILGRIVMGSLSDRIGIKYTLAISLGLISLTFIWLQASGALWTLYLFAVFYGFGYGSMIAMLTLAPANLFGLLSLGTLVGVFTCIYTFGGAVGPILTGYIYDVNGSYHLAFVIFAVLAAAGLVLSLCLKQPRREERE